MAEVLKSELGCMEFRSLDKLKVHNLQEDEKARERKKNFKCNVCGHKFINTRNLTNHMRTHTGERPFKCKASACGKTYSQESGLMRHILYKHSNKRPFKCDFPNCLKTLKTHTDLISHKKVHSDDRPFACPHSGCNFETKRKPNLSRHLANLHNKSNTSACFKCNFKTNSDLTLAFHMKVHEGRIEKIPCSIEGCEYKGRNNRAVKEHLRRHKNLLRCPVSGCGRYVHTKEALKDHVQRHSSLGRPFQCPLCFQHYRTLDLLQRHCFVHTNEKPFQCGHCLCAAGTRGVVKSHIDSVHAAIEFPFIVHLLNDRECLRCKVTLLSVKFADHCKDHVKPAVNIL